MNYVTSSPAAAIERLRALRDVDLNLFLVFTTIFELGSVTSAAEALGLTQPAVSHSLARLRATLGNELFVRHGNRLLPTPFAQSIIGDVVHALDTLRCGSFGAKHFDPFEADVSFRISMAVSMEIFLLPRLMEHLSREAPRVRVVIVREAGKNLEDQLASGQVSLALETAPGNINLRQTDLGTDQLVAVIRKENAIAKEGMSSENYLAARHILVNNRSKPGGREDDELERLGYRRDIAAECTAITAALRTVESTDLVVTLGHKQLKATHPEHDLAVFDFPFSQPVYSAVMLWHENRDTDPANQWLRQLVSNLFTQI
ncbi:MAG: LysR family transcriptional regulator [Pseudomonadales bacterium]